MMDCMQIVGNKASVNKIHIEKQRKSIKKIPVPPSQTTSLAWVSISKVRITGNQVTQTASSDAYTYYFINDESSSQRFYYSILTNNVIYQTNGKTVAVNGVTTTTGTIIANNTSN